MSYFVCFVLVAWAFAFGWFSAAVYMHNHTETTEGLAVSEQPEQCPECQAWRVPVVSGPAFAAD